MPTCTKPRLTGKGRDEERYPQVSSSYLDIAIEVDSSRLSKLIGKDLLS